MSKSRFSPSEKEVSKADSECLSQTVFSTEKGDLRKSGLGGSLGQLLGVKPQHPQTPPLRPASATNAPGKKLTVRTEHKGRRGKTVTLIQNYGGQPLTREDLIQKLRTHCGTGGAVVDDGTILVQGDHREKIVTYLRGMGLKPVVGN
jgi:translation initiation factor 1